MDKLELKALGKINLGLDVLGRRENGYHDVRMVMQTLYLYDNVTLQEDTPPVPNAGSARAVLISSAAARLSRRPKNTGAKAWLLPTRMSPRYQR